MKKNFLFLVLLSPLILFAQNKKPLDHTVYDKWESFGEKVISNDGKYIAYTINPQEGDGRLVIQQSDGEILKTVSRGYGASMTEDGKYILFKIKPWYKDTRDARIKKKKPDEMPKDSLGVMKLGDKTAKYYARVKSFKVPEKGNGWAAFLFEKAEDKKKKDTTAAKKMDDDNAAMFKDADEPGAADAGKDEGADLMLKNLKSGEEVTFKNVTEFFFNKTGKKLLVETGSPKKDSTVKPQVYLHDLSTAVDKTIFSTFNDAKSFALDEEGTQVAFVAERDSSAKSLQKFWKLWYYKDGQDSAVLLADRSTSGIRKGWTVNENNLINFSKSGKRLMFGTAPVLPPKDTLVPEIDRVNVDVWNYKDDFLQPQQLKQRDQEEKRNYLAVWDWDNKQVIQLGNEWINPIFPTKEGDGEHFYGASDSGMRVASQWQGFTVKKVYDINPSTGRTTEIKKEFKGNVFPSYTGKYLLMYDDKQKQYSVYNASTKAITAVTKDIKYPLYDEENDVPDDPNPYGIVDWLEDDRGVLVYDHYDIWLVDPENKQKPICITGGKGRKEHVEFRVVDVDKDQKFVSNAQTLYIKTFDEDDKSSGIAKLSMSNRTLPQQLFMEPVNVTGIAKAKYADVLVYGKETFKDPTALFVADVSKYAPTFNLQGDPVKAPFDSRMLATINPQQSDYSWGTAEIFIWTAYTGKLTEGVLYKPDNFDPKKKYPMLVYMYERNNQTLHNYLAPSPTPSRLNIPFFVSRGYVVFVPDVWYKTGYPGKSAYDYIVSGTRALIKKGFVDSTKIGLQGQSWGGYQIAYLITRTEKLYAAAWAGAPVANMTSAYGGIRWGSGVNRQFQYEKTQSRIGATLWEKPELYIENSPLFHLPKVKTPLVIMSNDADDAVPWYQGIEMFTALRRLGKPVWLLNYNGEAHNLVERKNRKDISIREQQFFDWMLKGEKPPQWITGGVPAVLKGRNLGLAIEPSVQ